MDKTLTSILCGEKFWGWDCHVCTIRFKENGTGELRCQSELCVLLAAELEWKLHSISHFDSSIDINSIDPTRQKTSLTPQLVSQFAIEITLSKNLIPYLKSQATPRLSQLNERNLLDEAFRPKIYTVRLEKGNFLPPGYAKIAWENEYTPRLALRLAFDPSPYPPLEEWSPDLRGPRSVRMWEWKEFCARESLELKALANKG